LIATQIVKSRTTGGYDLYLVRYATNSYQNGRELLATNLDLDRARAKADCLKILLNSELRRPMDQEEQL